MRRPLCVMPVMSRIVVLGHIFAMLMATGARISEITGSALA
jgi:hypothetical protein